MIYIDGDIVDSSGVVNELGKTLDNNFLEVVILLHCHFKDIDKVRLWLYTKNPHLGDIEPMAIIALGRGHKVLDFIKNLLDGETA